MANSTVIPLLTNAELMAFNIMLPIISLVGFITNAVVIISVIRYRSLREVPAHLFVVNLAVADIIVLAVSVPLWIVQLVLADKATVSQGMTSCQITFGLTVFSSILSIFTLGLISYDRYKAVTKPFQYHQIMSPRTTCIAVILLWLVSVVFSLPSFIGWKADTDINASFVAYCVYTSVFRQEYLLVTFSIAALTIVSNVFIYTKLLRVARRHARQIESVKHEIENSACDDTVTTGQRRTAPRKERNLKAAKTLGIVLGCLLVCWVPFLVVAFIDTVNNGLYRSVFVVKLLGTLTYVNSIINPIIYTYISRDFKKAIRRTFMHQRGISHFLGNSSS
eukprot:gene9875-10885_t